MSCRGELERRVLARGVVTRRSQADGHAIASVEINYMILEWCAVPSFLTKLASRSGAGEILGNFRSRNSPPGRSQKGKSKMPLVLELSTDMQWTRRSPLVLGQLCHNLIHIWNAARLLRWWLDRWGGGLRLASKHGSQC